MGNCKRKIDVADKLGNNENSAKLISKLRRVEHKLAGENKYNKNLYQLKDFFPILEEHTYPYCISSLKY
jgi:hypothetical protein